MLTLYLFTATCCFVYALPRQAQVDTAICHHTWPMCSDVPHPPSSAHNTALSSSHAISTEHRLLHSPSPPRENIRHSMRCRRRDMASSASTPVSHTQPLAANHRRSRITYATTDPTNSPTASPAKSDKLEADADPTLHRRPDSLFRHLFQPCHAQRGTSSRATSQRASLNAVHHKLCGAMISSSWSTTCTPVLMDLPSLSVELSAGHKKKEIPTEGGWGGEEGEDDVLATIRNTLSAPTSPAAATAHRLSFPAGSSFCLTTVSEYSQRLTSTAALTPPPPAVAAAFSFSSTVSETGAFPQSTAGRTRVDDTAVVTAGDPRSPVTHVTLLQIFRLRSSLLTSRSGGTLRGGEHEAIPKVASLFWTLLKATQTVEITHKTPSADSHRNPQKYTDRPQRLLLTALAIWQRTYNNTRADHAPQVRLLGNILTYRRPQTATASAKAHTQQQPEEPKGQQIWAQTAGQAAPHGDEPHSDGELRRESHSAPPTSRTLPDTILAVKRRSVAQRSHVRLDAKPGLNERDGFRRRLLLPLSGYFRANELRNQQFMGYGTENGLKNTWLTRPLDTAGGVRETIGERQDRDVADSATQRVFHTLYAALQTVRVWYTALGTAWRTSGSRTRDSLFDGPRRRDRQAGRLRRLEL
ncbi:protein UL150 [Human betaherpesvirus 5]|uniref:Protein UL150 n=1 Tax=Human cytomegalovirus TaxID=10359 RepID=A0A0G2T9J1_HCMV|nr:protein UL150 [Human betaherpesvirus 5]